MKFAVDRIINGIAVLENIETHKIINVEASILPSIIKEKDILRYDGSNYILDSNEKLNRMKLLQEKMNK